MSEQTTPARRISPVYSLVAIIALIGLGALVLWVASRPPAEDAGISTVVADDDPDDGITYMNPPRPMPDFTLTNQRGEAVSLSDLRGKPLLFAFGFTNCPDVCPLTLNDFKTIHDALGEQATNMQFAFISVDGKRDTPPVMQAMLERYRVAEFTLGLTGDPSDVDRLGIDYGLRYSYGEPNETGYYTVEHTAGTFLLDAEGRWVTQFAYGTIPSTIEAAIRDLLKAT